MNRNQDRRSTEDYRRKVHSIEYWDDPSSIERRSFPDRRILGERRNGWKRISEWASMFIGKNQ